jgi:TRAP-type C4-dicarboxylate transport system permease large subunit
VTRIVRDVMPFLAILILALLVITVWEDFVLFIPRQLGYQG